MFLAIAVDNLANAQILTEDEEREKEERERNRELNKQKYCQKPPKGRNWNKARSLPVIMALNQFVRKRDPGDGPSSVAVDQTNTTWYVYSI